MSLVTIGFLSFLLALPVAGQTVLGGSGDDFASGVALDALGNAYVTGETASPDFPAAGALRGRKDAFVAKVSPAGALLWARYLGGSGADSGLAVAVDGSGNVYVSGETDSADFPVSAGAVRGQIGGGSDAFVVKLDGGGSTVLYATYLGGSGNDRANGLAVDASGEVFVTGRLDSIDFPVTPGAFQTFFRGGDFDAFVTRLSAAGDRLVYSTYLAGSDNDAAFGIAVDAQGNAHVVGGSRSPDFPTTLNAYQGTNSSTDAFLTKLNAAGTGLLYSTLLGGSLVDRGNAVALDAQGRIWIAGQASSSDLPSVAALQPLHRGGPNDAFLARFDPSASGAASLLLATYLGGSGDDRAHGLAISQGGAIALAGQTGSTGFPTKLAVQPTHGGGASDAFASVLDPGGAALAFSTFVGGGGDDRAMGVALSPTGVAVIAGLTQGRGLDVLVARVAAASDAPPVAIPAMSTVATMVLALGLAVAGTFLISRRF